MPIFELSVDGKGLRMRQARNIPPAGQDPWGPPKFHAGKDRYPEFLPGQTGVANFFGKYRWLGMNLSMGDVAATLSTYLGRPVVDTTGLTARYDIDIKWALDTSALLDVIPGRRGDSESAPRVHVNDSPNGPTPVDAVQERLGLKLNSKKGRGDVVIIDHIEKTPIAN